MEATHWGRWARQLPFSSAVPVLVAPPVVGGILVGSLRALTNFDDPTASKGKGQQGKAADPVSLYSNRAAVPLQASAGSHGSWSILSAAAMLIIWGPARSWRYIGEKLQLASALHEGVSFTAFRRPKLL